MRVPKIDSAVHVWSDDTRRFPWAPHDLVDIPDVPGSIDALISTTREHHIGGVVLVQPRVYGYDHAYLETVADDLRQRDYAVASIALVNPIRSTSPADLTDLIERRRFSGVRLLPLAGEGDWFTHQDSDPLWRSAAELGTTISVLARAEQLWMVAARAREFPDISIVIDHLGLVSPHSNEHIETLLRCADLANCHLKISALAAVSGGLPPFEDLQPSVQDLVARFGPERCMIGSDWPYSLEDHPYSATFEFIERLFETDGNALNYLRGGTAATVWPALNEPRQEPT